MQKIEELIAALKKAKGPSLQLDGMIWCAANDLEFVMWDGAGCVYRDPSAPKWDGGIKHAQASTVRPYTTSIDAAVALVNRVLPGWHWNVGGCPKEFLTDADKPFSAELMGPVTYGVVDPEVGEEPIYDTAHAQAATAPIATCLATLKAKLAQEKNNAE